MFHIGWYRKQVRGLNTMGPATQASLWRNTVAAQQVSNVIGIFPESGACDLSGLGRGSLRFKMPKKAIVVQP
jgi:hypothetical protein